MKSNDFTALRMWFKCM